MTAAASVEGGAPAHAFRFTRDGDCGTLFRWNFEPRSSEHAARHAIPAECLRRAWRLERELNLLNPFPRPRGFVFKAKTWEEWHAWRAAHENPRLRCT